MGRNRTEGIDVEKHDLAVFALHQPAAYAFDGQIDHRQIADEIGKSLPREERRGRGFMQGTTQDFTDRFLACRQEVQQNFPIKPGAMVKKLGPPTAWDWACFEAVGRRFAHALADERVRLQLHVVPPMQAAGCVLKNPQGWGSLVFRCERFSGFARCADHFVAYRKPHCEIDRQTATESLGQELARQLGKRCSFGGRLVACTRPWKQRQCEQMASDVLSHYKIPPEQGSLPCAYVEQAGYKKALAAAKQYLEAFNRPPASATPFSLKSGQLRKQAAPSVSLLNCRSGWDPLALQCDDPTRLGSDAREMLADLPDCAQDPNLDGSDGVCFQGPRPLVMPRRPAQQIPRPGERPQSRQLITPRFNTRPADQPQQNNEPRPASRLRLER